MTTNDSSAFEDAKLWDLPNVDNAEPVDENQTNAFNKPVGKWKFEAPEQDQDIKPLTAQDIEEIRKAAFDDGLSAGHEQGFAEGHEKGLAAGKAEGLEIGQKDGFEAGKAAADTEAEVHLDALQALLEQLAQPLAKVNREVQNELVLLAVSLAKAVLKVEVTHSTDSLLQVINESMAVLPIQEQAYQLHLHADDLSALQAHLGEQTIQDNRWQLLSSAEQARGGCKVVSQNNAVDMSIARRCEQVFQQVLLNQGLADDPRAS
jgi:flagellar assembly protein FliH